MLSSVYAPCAIPYEEELLLRDPVDEHSVRCTRNGTLSYSIEDLWNATLSATETGSGARLGMQNKSRSFDPSILLSREALAHVPLQAIVVMAQVRIRHPFPCRQKRREPVGASHVTGIMLLSRFVVVMSTKRGGFAFGTESIR